MASETEKAMFTEDEVRRREFPKPEAGDPVGSIPLSQMDLPHHSGIDPTKEDERDTREEAEEATESS